MAAASVSVVRIYLPPPVARAVALRAPAATAVFQPTQRAARRRVRQIRLASRVKAAVARQPPVLARTLSLAEALVVRVPVIRRLLAAQAAARSMAALVAVPVAASR